jgi:methyl-accepting chemotaxis protein
MNPKTWIKASLRNGMIASVAVPLAFATILAAVFLVNEFRTVVEARSLDRSVQLIDKLTALVHEQQKERGATSTYINSGGKTFAPELKAQRALTDTRAAASPSWPRRFARLPSGPRNRAARSAA